MSDRYGSLHKDHLADRELRVLNAKKCLASVRSAIGFSSVVDFGCGIGAWLAAAKQLGATKVLGIEGEWVKANDNLLAPSELMIADLSKDVFRFERSFDLALSIEVAEHLPSSSADLLCSNLVGSANFLIFSAATPGQGGVNHVNEQKPRYWVDRFWELGFVPLEIIRPAIINEPKMYPWLCKNLMVFMDYSLIYLRPDLARFALPRQHFYSRYAAM